MSGKGIRRPESKLDKFAKNKWVVLSALIISALGLIVSAFGGVPGAIVIYHEFYDKPDLVYLPSPMLHFDLPPDQDQYSYVMTEGGLLNRGKATFHCSNFILEVKYNNNTYPCVSERLAILYSQKEKIKASRKIIDTTVLDFQTVDQFEPNTTVRGRALFKIPLPMYIAQTPGVVYKFIAIDDNGKQTPFELTVLNESLPNQDIYLPKSKIEFNTK